MRSSTSLVIVVGPTAVGKTAVAVNLAQRLATDVICADSMLVYKGMEIGTCKPLPSQRRQVVHHLIDICHPDEPFSAARYAALASQVIDHLHQAGKTPLVVGGCGLYIKALTFGLFPCPGSDPTLRQRLRTQAMWRGRESLHEQLQEVDPEAAARLHVNDTRRIIRALEVYQLTGCTLSALQAEHGFRQRLYQPFIFGLGRDREELYARIDNRVDGMLERGLVREVEGLLQQGYSPELAAMQGLGYRQMAAYLRGQLGYLEAVRHLKRDTRRYAKRQMTWFRKLPEIHWIDLSQLERNGQDPVNAIVEALPRFGMDFRGCHC